MNQISIFEKYKNPGFKKHGTSSESASAVKSTAKLLRTKCLEVLRRGAQTADEVAAYLG
jgi:hypothetical protein